jgi:hypothetical protein
MIDTANSQTKNLKLLLEVFEQLALPDMMQHHSLEL